MRGKETKVNKSYVVRETRINFKCILSYIFEHKFYEK